MTVGKLIESLIRNNNNEDTSREAWAFQKREDSTLRRFEVWVDLQGDLQIAEDEDENDR